ncbi:meckelin [Neocloeon triangulifer]|uniref:meckelin n=1 Tax=Neocloeon triangulifer TaxID=2078957 RepID=UPI00286F6638|nr:meckelin [Neocloeon triangulifer]
MISPLFLSALLFSLSFFRIFVDAEELIKFAEIGTCLPDEFYNVNLLQCSKCSHLANLVPTEDGFSCQCNAASVIVPTVGGEFPRCQKCPEDHEPSFDQRECVPCANLVTTTEEPNSTAVSLCASCPANHISVSTEWSGLLSQTPRCVACAPGFKARENLGAFGLCEPCNLRSSLDVSANCSCPVKSHELLRPPDEPPLCVPKSSLVNWPVTEKLAQVQFDTETVTSQLIKDRLRPSAILCQLGNRTACQFVANLCALNLYNDDDSGPSACKTFRDAKRTLAGAVVSGTEARPWLLYGDGDAPSVLAKRKLSPLKFTLTRNSNSSVLHLRAVKFSIEGKLIGLESGGASLLTLCPLDEEEQGLRFGAKYQISCLVSARKFLSQTTTLQDLYLEATLADGSEKLYPIPLLIRNMRGNDAVDSANWQFVRRMFLVDNELARTSKENKIPRIIRYLKSCKVKVTAQSHENAGQILPPLIELTYAEINQGQIEENSALKVSFEVTWEMEKTPTYSVQVSAAVLGSAGIVWAGIAAWSQSRRDGRAQGATIDLLTLVRLLLLACGPVANAFLLVSGVSGLLTLLLYKGQSVPHTLLPTEEHETLLRDLVISAAALKLVEVLHLLWMQTKVDLFFMDWERPKIASLPTPSNPVSIWRTYLVANEWNEIQATRRTSVAFQLLATTFLLQIIGIEHWATPDPDLHTSVQRNFGEGKSLALRFAVGLLVYIVVYAAQWIFITGFFERYVSNCVQQFIDLCSVANISVFIMSHENYGYYLHGRSAHGSADTDMQTLGEQLKREQEDLCAHRGLVPGCEQQTFEMAVPPKMRAFSRRVTAPLDTSAGHRSRRLMSSSTKNGVHWQGNADRIAQAYDTMNKFLAAFFQHAIRELDYEIKEKAFLEKLLDIELADSTDKAILYADDGSSFDRVLFHGAEFTLFSFDLALFCCSEMIFADFLLAAITTALAAKTLIVLRQIGGRNNVARKTLVDERFLI